MQRSRADDCYLVDAFACAGGRPVLLAGSHGGEGTTLRALALRAGRLQPYANFARNRQIVRCCHHDPQVSILLTPAFPVPLRPIYKLVFSYNSFNRELAFKTKESKLNLAS